MKTSELIAAVGDDNVGIQNIDTCATSLHWSEKKGARITFGSDVKILPEGRTDKLGLIVWLPRDRVSAIIATHAGEKK